VLKSDERQLLLSVLDVHGPCPVAEIERVDWPVLIRAAGAAKLLPTLAARTLPVASAIPDAEARATLRASLEQTTVHNTRTLAELARATGILRAAGIASVAMKGAALLTRHYPRPGMRYTYDFDLLVEPERIDEAVTRLRAAGYGDSSNGPRLGVDGRPIAETARWRRHATSPLTAPSGVHVDLHHAVPTSGFAAGGGFRGWLARAEPVQVQGEAVSICGADDLAVHLCEHFALQHSANPVNTPRLLCDLRAVFPGEVPWPRLLAGPGAQRAAVAVARALYEAAFVRKGARDPLTRILQRLAVSDPALMPVFAQISNVREHAATLFNDLTDSEGPALRRWFPARAYMAQRYGVEPRSRRIYGLYATRLWTAALRPFVRRA
jgi:hypothetical protein